MVLFVAGIVYGSMVDGKGLRTVVFLSGCSVHCPSCHNKSYWLKENGKKIPIDLLTQQIRKNTPQKKLTISGGEPLEQLPAVNELISLLPDFDIGLYTSYHIKDLKKDLLSKLSFVKTGRFEKDKLIVGKYFGSSNQEMIYLK
ncbi:MAG: 4Fe-4S cluster-binding domain-containing protein [Parachlamydiales bacterium]|jgi:anaerobic ribonucleoside-triphosphate reductase activating protein